MNTDSAGQPEVLHVKGGYVVPNPCFGLADAVKKIHASDEPRQMKVEEVPSMQAWLKSQAEKAVEHERAAQRNWTEAEAAEKQMKELDKSLAKLHKAPPSFHVNGQVDAGLKLKKKIAADIEHAERRAKHNERMAEQTRRITKEWRDANPWWPKLLADYNDIYGTRLL
ncbi:MAG: hypothetical protein WA609_12195 [Terriglobales bacterium]